MTVPKTLLRPVPHAITSPFGAPRNNALGYHRGTDYGAPMGSSCKAAQAGIVRVASKANEGGYGYHLVIEHKGYATLYAHLLSFSVPRNQSVVRGQAIAKTDNTGISTGPHLHFEVIDNYYQLYGGTPVNPELYYGEPAADLKQLTEGDMTAIIGVAAPNGIIAVAWVTNGLARRKLGTAKERTELAKAMGIPSRPQPVSPATLDALPIVVK